MSKNLRITLSRSDLRSGTLSSMCAEKFKDLTVVIPTLNEAEAIGKVIDEVLSVGVSRENILVVDGGSSDGTVDIARSRGVKVIMQEGKGKADAIRTALRYINTPLVLIMDGDYTYPASHIPDLYEKIREGYMLVIGQRVPEPGAQPLIYRLGNWMLTKFFNILFGTRLRDVLSGMYIVRSGTLREVEFTSSGFGIESEIVAHVVSTCGEVTEVPIRYRKRVGKKKLNVRHGLQILLTMIRLALRYNPVFLVFAIGSVPLIPGLIIGGWVLYNYFFTGVKYYVKGIIAAILVSTGYASLILSLISLYLKRMEYRILRMLRKLSQRE